MAQKTREILKNYFETGDRPTQQEFADLIDSVFNKTDDKVVEFLSGAKSSAEDAGEFGQISITDDYMYLCVQTGITGEAIWKKTVLFAT